MQQQERIEQSNDKIYSTQKLNNYDKKKILRKIGYLHNDVNFYQIGNTIVCDNIFSTYFECDLNQCHGLCCITGNSGAPLRGNELLPLQYSIKSIARYMDEQVRVMVDANKAFEFLKGEGYVTPMIKEHGCVYAIKKDDCYLCAFHSAYLKKKTTFFKPKSCALGPIRSIMYHDREVLHFRSWSICQTAHAVGKSLDIKLFQFLKQSIVINYGIEFFNAIENLAKALEGRSDLYLSRSNTRLPSLCSRNVFSITKQV